MANNKLAIIGGSGLYDVEEFEERELLDLKTPWGKPSDKILKTNYKNKTKIVPTVAIIIKSIFTDFKYFFVSGLILSFEKAPAPKDMTI